MGDQNYRLVVIVVIVFDVVVVVGVVDTIVTD